MTLLKGKFLALVFLASLLSMFLSAPSSALAAKSAASAKKEKISVEIPIDLSQAGSSRGKKAAGGNLAEMTRVPGTSKIKQKIEVRKSTDDADLARLRSALYSPDSKKNKKAVQNTKKAAAPQMQTATNNMAQENDRLKVMEFLISMGPAELDNIKKSLIRKTRQDNNLSLEDKGRIIAETTKFYDLLKTMDPTKRKEYFTTFQ